MTDSNIDWDFITDQIYQKRCTPIISNKITHQALFGDQNVIQTWAEKVNYPLADSDNLTRVAQFLSVTRHDSARAKSSYLQFLKSSLLKLARVEPNTEQAVLDDIQNELRSLTFSQLAIERLGYPNLQNDPNNPLNILAALDIPIYLTTGHHNLMEAALEAVGKSPRTEVYCWQEGQEENIPVECQTDLDFEPDVQTPLVYHWHGIDSYPNSLVLTEDDHLEFLVHVTQNFQESDTIPSTVRNALSSSLLLLLGYDLHAWDLRVLLQGVIKDPRLRPRSFAIQLEPNAGDSIKDTVRFRKYLQDYFGQVRFDVYWGTPRAFMQTLHQEWKAG
jgi:hypothetical protein